MDIFREENKGEDKGKVSSKRVVGVVLVIFFLLVVILKIFIKVEDVSDTILGSTLGAGIAQLTSTLFKK